MKILKPVLLAAVPIAIVLGSVSLGFADGKPKLTLDEFFNSVSYSAVALSPDGNSVVIGTERADWDQQIFRHDLWLYRDDGKGGSLIQLTQSGNDVDPQWSPDGRWIAFRSERKLAVEKDSDSGDAKDAKANDARRDDKDDKGDVSQIYVISPSGGEAIPLTQGEEEVHTFSWSADSRTLYFATRNPWTKAQKDDYKKAWKDVLQYRTAERGDTIFSLDLAATLARHTAAPALAQEQNDLEKDPDLTPGARAIATSPLRVENLVTSPDGTKLAFLSSAINQREEKFDDYEIYALDLANPTPRRLTHNQAQEGRIHWASDNRHIFFTVEVGDVTGPYRDLQPHLYWVNSDDQKIEQWNKDFVGPVDHYTVAADTNSDNVLASARLGTEVSMYSATQPSQSLHKLNGWDGTYEILSTAIHSPRVAFVYSSMQKPTEVYLAPSPDQLGEARPITSLNGLFTERDLPQGKPFRWKADDGTTIEGMLIYPPGIDPEKSEAKNLPLFTFIHGGPADADGNHFEADWYEWSRLAATNGWLVFEPNYRGSTGYGDKFLQQIVPVIVSRPGKDILEGVDALVKAGIADPDHLAVGGYSYGGYMTNWLITQTTRFKAAVTGAGGGTRRQLGQRRHHLRRRLLPRRTPLGSRAALSRRSCHLPDR